MSANRNTLARWKGICFWEPADCCGLPQIMIVLHIGKLVVFECPGCRSTFTVPVPQ